LVRAQRFGLSSRPVERGHELGREALAQRIFLYECFELSDQLRVSAEQQVGVDAVFDCREPRLFEPRDHRPREFVVREVDECVAAPEREGVAEHRRCGLRVARVEGGPAFRRESVEAGRIERVSRQVERVATSACRDLVFAERASQTRDVNLQVVARRDALAAPDVFQQLVGRHRVPLRQREVDEQPARTRAADVDGSAVVVEHFQRPQNSEFHCVNRRARLSAPCKLPDRSPDEGRGMPDGDPLSAHELAVLAWEAYTRNQVADAARLASRASRAAVSCPRRHRQEIEVVCLAISGESARAYGLAYDHLGEFPHDDLVRRVKDASE
jgi:hypothetical protein